MTTVPESRAESRRVAAGYLLAQAAVLVLWWAGVFASRTVRGWFFPYGGLDPAFAAFIVPDLAFIAGGSVVVARALLRGRTATLASGILLGAVGYATVYTLAWALALHAPAGGVIATLVMAFGTWRACR